MPLPQHLPHIIYATALTSLSLHLLSTRKTGAAARQQAEARISLLDGLATRLRAGEHVPTEEVQRVRWLMRDEENEDRGGGGGGVKEESMDWKTVVLGKKDKGS